MNADTFTDALQKYAEKNTSFSHNKAVTFEESLQKNADEEKQPLYVGINLAGVKHLAVENGEPPRDFHVTLLYGYFIPPRGDDDDATSARIMAAVSSIMDDIPQTITLNGSKRFEASASSDGNDVIVALVKPGQLEELHKSLLKALKERGISVEKTFPTYTPHMTLAYIEKGSEFELPQIEDEEAKSTSITVGIADYSKKINKSQPDFAVFKTDDDERLVFGWANVAIRTDGEQIEDLQDDIIDTEDLEAAAYEYVLNFRDCGEEHIPEFRKKARMVESCVFTKEKMAAMGIPEGIVPEGWWIGFRVDDDEAWEKVKNGTYRMFSIEGKATRVAVEGGEE